jgi:hypothetical protein
LAPLQPTGLEALVPQPAAQDLPARTRDIVLTVRADGTVLLNWEPVPPGSLPAGCPGSSGLGETTLYSGVATGTWTSDGLSK